MAFTISTLATQLGLPVPEKGADKQLLAIKPLHEAGPEDLSFLDNAAYRESAKSTRAAAVLVRPQDAELLPKGAVALITTQPYVAFARALQLMHPDVPPVPGISQFAVASTQATIHPTARVEPYAVIYAGATIGEGAHIAAHAVIGVGVQVGAGTRVGAHSSLFKCTIGKNCIIHPNVCIGQDGFGFAVTKGENGEQQLIKVPQIGHVRIGNNVEIGAGTTVDCGALGDTIIEDDVKIDNQVQIGHNARIGKGTRIVAQVGIAGSATIGKFNVIGGQSGIAGHIETADGIMVAARSGVTKSLTTPGSVVAGIPAVPIQEWRRQSAALARIAKNRPMPVAAAPEAPAPVEDTETPADPHTGNPFA